MMRRNSFARISIVGILIQLIICMPAAAANLKASPTQRIAGVVKDALGRPLKDAALALQASDGHVVAHSSSNDAGEFSFSGVVRGTYAVVATKQGFKPATAIVSVSDKGAPPVTVAMEAEQSVSLAVAATRLDKARNSLSPDTGGSKYTFSEKAIQQLPQGENTALNQVLLQAPGVAQDSFGQLHVRGDHANLQFRINGVQLPEGIQLFGQTLETRLAHSVALITGALPAQYGFRTAGIIDIQTKTGTLDPGGAVSMYGGSHDWVQPSFEWSGRVGQLDYFITGEYLRNGIGIENPTNSYHPLHDETNQYRGFAYLSGIIDPTARVTGVFGTSRGQFQIPNTPGLSPGLGLVANGITDFNSAALNENQRQITHYSIVALQEKLGPLDLQISAFQRYSSLYFSPDLLGELLFNGIAQNAYRRSIATGSQADGSYRVNAEHTVRAGYFLQGERSI